MPVLVLGFIFFNHGFMAYDEKIIKQASLMYSLGANIEDIRKELDLPNRRVVYQWAKRFEWDAAIDTSSLVVKTSRRINWLIEKDKKSHADWDEISRLGDLLIKLEKADSFKRGEAAVSNRGRKPGQKSGSGKRRKKPSKNDVSEITVEMLDEVEQRVFYRHQKIWLTAV